MSRKTQCDGELSSISEPNGECVCSGCQFSDVFDLVG